MKAKITDLREKILEMNVPELQQGDWVEIHKIETNEKFYCMFTELDMGFNLITTNGLRFFSDYINFSDYAKNTDNYKKYMTKNGELLLKKIKVELLINENI